MGAGYSQFKSPGHDAIFTFRLEMKMGVAPTKSIKSCDIYGFIKNGMTTLGEWKPTGNMFQTSLSPFVAPTQVYWRLCKQHMEE